MTVSMQMHFSSLLQKGDRTFCIVTDNALAPHEAATLSTRSPLRRVDSAPKSLRRRRSSGRRTVPRVRSLPKTLPSDESVSNNNRWSSGSVELETPTLPPSAPPRIPRRSRFSDEAQEGLNKIASRQTRNVASKNSHSAPQKPVRKALDDEEEDFGTMSLAELSKATMRKGNGLSGVRSLRRPQNGCQGIRRNIVDILGEAIDNLDIDEEP